jgi:hypothetical protein
MPSVHPRDSLRSAVRETSKKYLSLSAVRGGMKVHRAPFPQLLANIEASLVKGPPSPTEALVFVDSILLAENEAAAAF